MRSFLLGPVLLAACASAAAPAPPPADDGTSGGAADVSSLRFAPPAGARFGYRRSLHVIRAHDTSDETFTGTWAVRAEGEVALTVLPPGGASTSGPLTLHYDARGLPTGDAVDVEGLSNDASQAFTLAPIGSAIVGLPLTRTEDGAWSGVLPFPDGATLGMPIELPTECTASSSEGGAWDIACRVSRTQPMPARGDGWERVATFRAEVTARVDASGVAHASTYHFVVDLTQTLGDHVEHEGGEATVETELTPMQ